MTSYVPEAAYLDIHAIILEIRITQKIVNKQKNKSQEMGVEKVSHIK